MIELAGTASLADVVAVADGAAVRVPDAVVEAVGRAHAAAHRLSQEVPTYGRTTGVGANKSAVVDDDAHGLRLLRSHAVDAGEELPARAVRAMLAVRLNQLCVTGSGVAPAVLRALERMLNENALPTVRAFASIGTGDLGALAGTALTLMGERPATGPLEPMAPWSRDSALPFMSSSALTIGRTCLVVDALDRLDRAAAVVYALSFRGLDGNPSVLSPAAVRAVAAPGVGAVAERTRRLLGAAAGPAGPAAAPAARIQDAYGLRAFPISQGAFTHALGALNEQAGRLLGTAQENPLFDLAGEAVVHHGAFHQVALGLALDGCALALAQTGPLVMSRIGMLNEPRFTGLRPFLAAGQEGASGLMMIEYVAAGALAELRASAQPASLGSVVLSRGAEEDASFASQAVVQGERAVAAYRSLLACELVGAVRLLRQRGVGLPAGPLRDALDLAGALPAEDTDRDLRGDLEIARALLDGLARV
ncbi:aromatic amino acid ammonia-lyase [Antribacter sp. KLBMP9083]|uniref:Aromatic amino acid ammonia-lyase n=1 Tax=Antribacter soli TaxID=2910976 RepID=A0AA41QEY4_9MICO|nr:aromatic amino acid ammonia-lyase [Antribacter soli]MCF4121898.1 aromatic amino acid ammonia-lyase [Antribacter soli]